MSAAHPLAGIEVVEYGARVAVTACGSVLAALGARVHVYEQRTIHEYVSPPAHRAGKDTLAATDAAAVLARADVVITSSDLSPVSPSERPDRQIRCDITAYGTSGPLARIAHPDALVQAMAGLADTTGDPAAPPTLCRFPQTEGIAALYAAAGILTALLARHRTGSGQDLEIAQFDCAFSTLSTFLPFHFIGKPVTRSGNRHVLASPWNAYRAGDGWLLICTGSDDQWKRLCEVIGQPELARDERLARAQDRVQHREIVDSAVQHWISSRRAADAATALEARGIAAGPVVPVARLGEEPNLAHRGMYTADGMQSAIRHFPRAASQSSAAGIPGSGESARKEHTGSGPLTGMKVLEIGQYTTAPLVARNLGALGADALKIEPPDGDATRAWPPQQDGQGHFFTLSNSDKMSARLDLRAERDRERFRALLRDADVLVENLKPGSLDKLGFGPDERAAINPRLVYCAISGFGADSAYPGRPAFDTVIQAMSGIMDSIQIDGVPQKTGVSFADVLGGAFALTGTLAALVAREHTGAGNAIDISMQDAAAWITQWHPSSSSERAQARVIACSDGYVAAALPPAMETPEDAHAITRDTLIARLTSQGHAAARVQTISEVAQCAQTVSRELIRLVPDSAGHVRPVFASPIRLSATPAVARRAIGPLGEANAAIWNDTKE